MRIARYVPDRIVNDIQDLRVIDYQQAVDEFITRFRKQFPYPAAFYQFGQVSSPGVSDIDILIVCRDQDWQRANALAREASTASETMQYLFIHPPDVASTSLLPSLAALHTLQGLTPMDNHWDPIIEGKKLVVNDELSLMRHIVWNSCFRVVAPIFLDTEEASLRQVLIRLKNLLASAEIGNRFLSKPKEIPIISSELRKSILECPPDAQSELCREYIGRVVALLDEVDRAIDAEFGITYDCKPMVTQPTHYCRCVSPLDATVRERLPLLSSKCPGGWVISTPRYLMEGAGVIAKYTDGKVPLMRPLSVDVDPSRLRHYPGAKEYARHLTRAYELSVKAGVPYGWPLPFGMSSELTRGQQMLRYARRFVGATAYGISQTKQGLMIA